MPTLPFIKEAYVSDQQGSDLFDGEAIPCSPPWPANRSVFAAGAHYDFTAEVPREYADIFEQHNLSVHIDGHSFKVIDREKHDYLPHGVLRLRETRAGG